MPTILHRVTPDAALKVHEFLEPEEPGRGTRRWYVWCPGCQEWHQLDERWTFNNNYAAPTFRASYLIEGSRRLKADRDKSELFRCHSYITDGSIQFLKDCTHSLAGQTVPLPEHEH